MAQLIGSAPSKGRRYYLDTSAVLALTAPTAAAKGQSIQPKDLQRASDLKAFLEQARTVGATACTTVLAIQELAAKVRRDIREFEAARANHKNWNTLRRSGNRAESARVDAIAHAAMLTFMTWAVRRLSDLGVVVDRPPVAGRTANSAAKLRKKHRDFLRRYPGIDAMDALHIAIGSEMKASDFVSFDLGWGSVGEITVHST